MRSEAWLLACSGLLLLLCSGCSAPGSEWVPPPTTHLRSGTYAAYDMPQPGPPDRGKRFPHLDGYSFALELSREQGTARVSYRRDGHDVVEVWRIKNVSIGGFS